MKLGLGFLLGSICAVLIIALLAYLSIVQGWIPARGDEPASPLEQWAAHHALHAVLSREGPQSESIAGGRNQPHGAKIYADNCSGCHGAPRILLPHLPKALFQNRPFSVMVTLLPMILKDIRSSKSPTASSLRVCLRLAAC